MIIEEVAAPSDPINMEKPLYDPEILEIVSSTLEASFLIAASCIKDAPRI